VGSNQLVNDAELVTSELVTNAIHATGTTNPQPRWSELHHLALIAVRLVVTVDCLVIEVWDRDPRPPVPKDAAAIDKTGRGLLIVGTLCRRWDYFFPESGGKAVWAELVIPAVGSVPSGLPLRQQPRLASECHADLPSTETLERVLEGLRKV
jgi:hypothetical protein